MARGGALLYILVTYVMVDVFSATKVEDFWPSVRGNLTTLTWAHAVNNASFLSASLQDASVMMLEADVQLGTLSGGGTQTVPIMAHPPNTVSDLSLALFLQNVSAHNQNSTTSKKGVKLDFKSIEAFAQSQAVITANYNASYPIWLNADILSGPGNSTTTPVNSTEFLSGAKALNLTDATLSLGWTTALNATANVSYTDAHVDDMLSVLAAQNVNHSVTFAVRAAIAAESNAQIARLLNGTAGSTITVWSSEGDAVNVTGLRQLIRVAGVDRTYLDVPATLAALLDLGNLTATMGDGNGTTVGNNTTTNGTTTGNNTTTNGTNTNGNGTSTTGGTTGVLATGLLVLGALILGASW